MAAPRDTPESHFDGRDHSRLGGELPAAGEPPLASDSVADASYSTKPDTPSGGPAHHPPVHFVATVGASIGPYRLERLVGAGGMGTVWEATHLHLLKRVALKLLPAHLMADPGVVARFRREMQAAGRVTHSNVVTAFDAGEAAGVHYLAMEYIDGSDLQAYVRTHGPLAIQQACDVVRQAALGLAAAHAEGLVHRDVKPLNLLLNKAGQVKLLDLGLARLVEEATVEASRSGLTAAGQTMGTPDYMAPEQWEDTRSVGPPADLYSLGCTLFFLLVGRPPFGDEAHVTNVRKMMAHVNEPPPDLATHRPDAPPELSKLYRRLLAKQPADRFADAAELSEELRRWAAGQDVQAVKIAPAPPPVPESPPGPTPRPARFSQRPPRSAKADRADRKIVRDAATAPATHPLLTLERLAYTASRILLGGIGCLIFLYAGWMIWSACFGNAEGRSVLQRILICLTGVTVAVIAALMVVPHTPLARHGRLRFRLTLGAAGLLLFFITMLPIVNRTPNSSSKVTDALTLGIFAGVLGLTPLLQQLWHRRLSRRFPVPTLLLGFRSASSTASWPSDQLSEGDTLEEKTCGEGSGQEPSPAQSLLKRILAYWPRMDRLTKRQWFGGAVLAAAPAVFASFAVLFLDGAKTPEAEVAPITDEAVAAVISETPVEPRSLLVLRHEKPVNAVAFSPNGSRIVTGSGVFTDHIGSGTALLWDAVSGTPIGEPLPHEDYVGAVAFSPDGTQILTGSGYIGRGIAQLWDAASGAPIGEPLSHDDYVSAVAFSPDGSQILTGSGFVNRIGTALLWDAVSGAPIGEPLRHEGEIRAVAFSRNGSRILTGSMDNTARLWDAASGAPIGEPLRHEDVVSSVAFSPDGSRILTGSFDNTARLWDAVTGTPVGEPLQHAFGARVLAVSFSPDGAQILTGVGGGTAQLWETATGRPIGEPLRHKGSVNAVAFSPDGLQILTGSYDDTARLWDVSSLRP